MQSVANITECFRQSVDFLYDLEKVQALRKFFGGLRQDVCKIFMDANNSMDIAEILIALDKTPDDASFIPYRGRMTNGSSRDQLYMTVKPTPRQLAKLQYYHVIGTLNLCLFFDLHKNNLLCFNTDGNREYFIKRGDPADSLNDSVTGYVSRLCSLLRDCGLDTLTVQTGNGYHTWVRFAEPIDNAELQAFAEIVTKTIDKLVLAESILYTGKTDRIMLEGRIRTVTNSIHPLPSIMGQPYCEHNIENNSIRLPLTVHCNTSKFTGFIENGYFLPEKESFDRLKNYKSATMEQFIKAKGEAEVWLAKELQ